MKNILCVCLLLIFPNCQYGEKSSLVKEKNSAVEGQIYGRTMPSKITHQINAETPYYISGPEQARPADGILPVGTKIKVVRSAGSYALISTETGITAYVSMRDIVPVGEP